MRHGMVNRKLGRTSAHRNALFRNQLASLIDRERIITTLPKAKELKPQIERLVTLARTDSVHNRRQIARVIADDVNLQKLFGALAQRFADRPGGYTRIIKLGPRRGDAAEMCILEFVDFKLETEAPAEETPAKGAKKAAPKKETKAKAEPEEEEEPKPKAKPKKPAKAAAKPKAEKPKAKEKPAAKKTAAKKKSGK
jgi:large subunit ribosomal protein L17